MPPVYGLDATDVSQWKEKVHIPAVEILTAILKVQCIYDIYFEDLFLIVKYYTLPIYYEMSYLLAVSFNVVFKSFSQ